MTFIYRSLLLPVSLLLALAVHAGTPRTVTTVQVNAPLLKADTTVKPAKRDSTQKIVKPLTDTTKHTDTALVKKPLKKPVPARVPDSIYLSPGGFRIGVDISRIPVHFFQPYRTDITVQTDMRVNGNIYAALEGGYNRTSHSDTNYTYKGSGYYATLGIDYDLLKKQTKDELNMVYLGFRYGYARTNYSVPFYAIKDSIWGANIQGKVPPTTSSAHWIELVFGMRVEVLKHLFVGWGVREKIMIYNSADKAAPPLVIAGFGSGNKRSQFDMTYSVSYQIPLYKVKVHVPRPQPPKKRQ